MNMRNIPIYQDTDDNICFKRNIQDQILQKLEEEEKDSGWTLSSIKNLDRSILINSHPCKVPIYWYTEFPKKNNKKACINIKTKIMLVLIGQWY